MSATAEVPLSAEPAERPSDIADVPEAQRADWIEKVWRIAVSVKLMVVLMALFALTMAMNTFINPQEDALVQIEKAFADRPTVVWLYRVFELYAPFKSWWFTTIILLLALNNLASSIERLPRIFFTVVNPERKLTERVLMGLRNKRTLRGSSLKTPDLKGHFEKAGYVVTETADGGTTYLFGERGAWTRFGVWLVHLALLLVCGGMIGKLWAYEGTIDLPENGGMADSFTERLPDGTILRRPLGHIIRCDDFHLDKFADGAARRFMSDLSILSFDGKVLAQKHIIVGDPMVFDGRTFYQATYSERPDQSHAKITIRDRETKEVKTLQVSARDQFSLGDGSVKFSVSAYERQFGELGPAVQIVREEGTGESAKTSSFWVFQNYPEFDFDMRGDRFGIAFEGLSPMYVTGLQVGHDPSAWYLFVGCFLMAVGLFIAFWTVHRRVWARVEEDGTVTLAGAAHRNKEAFRTEFDRLVSALNPGEKSTA